MHIFRRLAPFVVLALITAPLVLARPAGAAGAVPSTTTLTSDPATGEWGGVVFLIATVDAAVGTPTGTVSFFEGPSMRGTISLTDGEAQFMVEPDAVGTRTFTAQYNGDNVYATSTSDPYVLTVGKGTSETELTAFPPTTLAPGEAFQLDATVDTTTGNPFLSTYQPVGTVTLARNGTTVDTENLTTGGAQFLFPDGALPGAHSFVGQYSGDAKLRPSESAPVVVNVRKWASATTATPPSDRVEGKAFAFTSVVGVSSSETAPVPNGVVPGGTAKVVVDNVLAGEAALDGTGTLTLPLTLSGGVHKVQVQYLGDGNFGSSVTTIDLSVAKSGYVMLSANGQLWGFGAAGNVAETVNGRAVDVEVTPARTGSWILTSTGQVFVRGAAPNHGSIPAGALAAGEEATSISSADAGKGYWIFTSRGRVFTFGTAPHLGDMAGKPLNGPVLDSIPTPSGLGYYMVASDGGIFAFGDAAFRGSMGGRPLNRPVQSLVPDPDGVGYWLVASDGGVFAFDAGFRGSMGGTPLNRPVTGMVAWGDGYLMVAEDGGVFSFSDRPFLGSLGSNPPSSPIVALSIQDGTTTTDLPQSG